jgi:1-deoxyxylulose-5-phosphate synthase
MDYVYLGATGLSVSRVCLGMMSVGDGSDRAWVIGEDEAEPLIRAAVEGGVTFFDTADVYSQGASEVATGHLLPKFLTRDEMVVATKVFNPMHPRANGRGLGRKHILSGIDASLTRLGMDYVDLYQIHRFDQHTPVEETMAALDEVVKSGKARYIGASSMYAWQFAQMQHAAELAGTTKFVSMQDHYNLIYREEEREMIPFCQATGVGVIPWSPLARGVLAGNRTRSGERLTTRAGNDAFGDNLYSVGDFDIVDRVVEVAKERDAPPAQVALAWLIQRAGVTAPIVGATKLHHVTDAIAAEALTLTEAEIARLEELYVPHEIKGHS